LKTAASAILADVEPGFQPGGENAGSTNRTVKSERFRQTGGFSRRRDAALYGRPGGLPLLFKQALKGKKAFKLKSEAGRKRADAGVKFVGTGAVVRASASLRCARRGGRLTEKNLTEILRPA